MDFDNADSTEGLNENTAPKRQYPWGDTVDAERMNFAMNIGDITSAGCFPDGASPYGCEEMAGTVWEWTRSVYAPYPYPDDPVGRREREARSAEGRRVLRGGAFSDDRWDARCAFRYSRGPGDRGGVIGFRVMLSPLSLHSEISGL